MEGLGSIKRTCISLAVAQAISISVAQAAIITVNDQNDMDADDLVCSLREAVESANDNPMVSTSGCVAGEVGVDTILFESSLYGNITLTQGTSLNPTEDLIIQGPGHSVLSIDASANGMAGIFSTMEYATLEINDITLTGAKKDGRGGAIYAPGDASVVNLSSVHLTYNSATTTGGAIAINNGTLTMTDSTVSGNSASEGGGLYAARLVNVSIVNSIVSDNTSQNVGGGIYTRASLPLTISGGELSNNTAGTHGGGLFLGGTAQVQLLSTTVSGNSAGSGEGQRYGGGACVASGSILTSNDTQWRDNYATYGGAAATRYTSTAKLYFNRSTFIANSAAAQGGALRIRFNNDTYVDQSSFSQNSATNSGGAISNSSRMTVTNSTLSNNMSGSGGGLSNGGELTVINSTISSNTAAGSGGGGISISSSVSYTDIVNSTVVKNVGIAAGPFIGQGGGVRLISGASVGFVNSIISGNMSPRGNEVYADFGQSFDVDQSNVFGSSESDFESAFFNFTPDPSAIDATSDSAAQAFPFASIVEGLVDNGGLTMTHALAPKSPAIDAGNVVLCFDNQVVLDQLGQERDANCDIGSVEFVAEETSFFVVPVPGGKSVIFGL